jgi:hypothetical protein
MKILALTALLLLATSGLVLGQNGQEQNGQGQNDQGQNGQNGQNGHNGAGAPEIDPGSAVGALALLSGGILVIRGRRKK